MRRRAAPRVGVKGGPHQAVADQARACHRIELLHPYDRATADAGDASRRAEPVPAELRSRPFSRTRAVLRGWFDSPRDQGILQHERVQEGQRLGREVPASRPAVLGPGRPRWATKSAAREAERRYRERRETGGTQETCASFAERWLEEWPRGATSTQRQYRDAMKRFAAHFGPTPLGDVERLSARTWALSVPRYIPQNRSHDVRGRSQRGAGWSEHNPFSNLRLPTAERTEQVRPPTLDEYREILNACTVLGGYGGEFRVMVQFAALDRRASR